MVLNTFLFLSVIVVISIFIFFSKIKHDEIGISLPKDLKRMGALSVFWTLLAFYTVSAQCCELVQNGFFRENGDCAPCQEEKVAYFGNNIKVKILELCFLEGTINEFWSFKVPLFVNIWIRKYLSKSTNHIPQFPSAIGWNKKKLQL